MSTLKVRQSLLERNSAEEFGDEVLTLCNAGSGVIHVRTGELVRTIQELRKTVILNQFEYYEWTTQEGLQHYETKTIDDFPKSTDNHTKDFLRGYEHPYNMLKEGRATNPDSEVPAYQFYVYVMPHYWMESPPVQLLTHYYASELPTTDLRVILITPDQPIVESLASCVKTIHFHTPGIEEMKESILGVLQGMMADDDSRIPTFNADDETQICFAGAGMSKLQFETALSEALVRSLQKGDDCSVADVVDGISKYKTDIVNKNDLLELVKSGNLNDVGGMDVLKDWISKRRHCYSDEAQEYGVEAPKGIVFVGPPGTGKSLIAKAIGASLGIPIVRLDIGRVFNALVGSSEERMRMALKMVESMSPCVLFVDEVDKGLGGMGGSGDSGTSSRVLGTFLTWLQDNEHPVFTMVTANNVTHLPPELLRRGRFDAIFSTTLPSSDDRLAVLDIHLRRRGRRMADFPQEQIDSFAEASVGYVPAEIESAVKDGLVNAFSEMAADGSNDPFNVDMVRDALLEMKPLSEVYRDQIDEMKRWAESNAILASSAKEKTDGVKTVTKRKPRRTRTPRITKH